MTRILIVEDSATQAEELAALLESRGFEISIARDGLSGVERCRTEPFDVVLSDVIMPGINGYELCQRLKRAPETADVPVVLLTALTEPLDIIKGLECGADNFITKPYDVDYLVSRIGQLLANRKLRSTKKLDVGVELMLMGKRFTINSQKEQMVDLLLSTFEEVMRSRQREYEAKIAEESHRRSHDLLQSALDALHTQIGIVEESGEILAVNAAWRRMADRCNWPWPGSGVGQDYRVILEEGYHVGLSAASSEAVDAVRSGRKQFHHLEFTTDIRGEARWFRLAATRFEGNGLALLALEVEDVTERKRAMQDVERSELQLRRQTHILNSILNSMGEGVVVAEHDGRLLLVNRRAEELLGIDISTQPEDWSQISRKFVVSDERGRQVPKPNPLLSAVRGELNEGFDLMTAGARPSTATMLAVTGAPLRDQADTLHGGVLVLRDVTQQRRLEQQLRESQKMEAIGQLAGGVAHDFNNLLSVIVSYGQLVVKDLPENDRHRDDIMQMLSAAGRATALTRQLLAFSRREMVKPAVLEMNAVVSNVEKMLRRIIGEDIDLSTLLDPNLGRVKADSGQLEQVLMNLCVNARDAMPDGGKLTIETQNVTIDESFASMQPGLAPGHYVLLSVSDTGIGMDSETKARIFEPFFTTKEVGKGTGLGLSTVYGIVKQSGGYVGVYSEPGLGSTFRVYLPRVDEAVAEVVERPRSVAPSPGERILIVEDEDAVRAVAARILEEFGYRVMLASGASEARKICAQSGPSIDLLLTDVIMRETNGVELAAELKRDFPRMRVLFMSGYSGGAAIRHGTLPAGQAFLEKPFSPESLTEKVRDVLGADDGRA